MVCQFTLNLNKYISHMAVWVKVRDLYIKYTYILADPSQMVVTWVTLDPTSRATVEYGLTSIDKQSYGYTTTFIDGGAEQRMLYIHRVVIANLTASQRYSKTFPS